MDLSRIPLVLNKELQYALDQLEHASHPIFVSGKAGTGKSTLLQIFRNTSQKKIAVVAPTGVAALNVRGQTIHSFFKIPPRILSASDIKKVPNRSVYKNLEVLVIDEISMVRADLMDTIDTFLRINRERQEPFGGVRIVLFGDLFQLPPVISSPFEKEYINKIYESPYFFSSERFQRLYQDLEFIELQTVYRQHEGFFISILDQVRTNQLTDEAYLALNERVTLTDEELPDGAITLCTINAIADKINHSRLEEIQSEARNYKAAVTGLFDPKIYPTDLMLKLKVGAQVMTLRNDQERRFVNGSIGKILHMQEDSIELEIFRPRDTSLHVSIHKETWEMIKYQWHATEKKISTEIIGTFTQLPVKLSWATTIHKSQGKTFDKVIIDLGRGAFEYGQTYVALSRCTSLEGIYLKKSLTPRDFMADPRVAAFYDSI